MNIAVIGAGYWGKKVIREALNVSRITGKFNLATVVDNSPSSLQQCQREFGPLEYCLSYDGLLADPDISAVHICSPNSTHFQVASDFLNAGKHVLVEKPLALHSREADELVRLAEENHRVLAVGHIHRFNNGINALRQLIQAGVLGDIYYLRFQWTGFLPPQRDREVVTDLGPHPFDICNNLLGTWPMKVCCISKGYRGGSGGEVAFLTAEHADGVNASVELSWLDAEKHRDVVVVGSDAIARLDCLTQQLTIQRPDKVETIPMVPSNTLQEEILHFGECIEKSSRSESFQELNGGAVGAGVVRILEAAGRSLREERTVPLRVPECEELVTNDITKVGFRKLT